MAESRSVSGHSRRQASTPRARHWTVNKRLLTKSAILLIVLVPSLYFWHAYQLRRSAASLLNRAASQEQSHDLAAASSSLDRYLTVHPEDVDARIRMTKAYGQIANTYAEKQRAVRLYAQAIGLVKDDLELRRKHMNLLMDLGEYSGALDAAKSVLDAAPADAAALRVVGLARYALWRFAAKGSESKTGKEKEGEVKETVEDRVIQDLDAAIAANPADASLAGQLATIYRRDFTGKESVADEVMNQLIARNPTSADALLRRYAYRAEFQLPGAKEDLQQALKLDPDKKNHELQLAEGFAKLKEDPAAAIESFNRFIEIAPRDRRGYTGLGQAYAERREYESSLDAWQRGLRAVGGKDLDLQMRVVATLIELKRAKEADDSLGLIEKQVARNLGPDQGRQFAFVYTMRARLALTKNDYAKAVPFFKQALSQQPSETATMTELADCYRALEQWDQAALMYQNAAEVQPKNANIRLAAAACWDAAGRLDEAVRQYEQGVTLDKAPANAGSDFAHALYRQQLAAAEPRKWDAFERALNKAQELQPDSAPLKLLSAEFKASQGNMRDALAILTSVEPAIRDTPDLWKRLVKDYEALKRPANSDRFLAEIKKKGASAVVRLLEIDLLVSRKRNDEAEKQLLSAIPSATGNERSDLSYRLAVIHLLQGKSDLARRELTAEQQPGAAQQSRLRLLAELALDAGDLKDAERWESELERIEGATGTSWRFYRGQRLLIAAAKLPADDAQRHTLLAQVSALQEDMSKLRPNWPLTHVLKARALQLVVNPDVDAAIDAYKLAIRNGEARFQVLQELLTLLYRQNRLAEADEYLRRVESATDLPPALASLVLAVDVKQGNLTRAIKNARKLLEINGTNGGAHLRLAQLLIASATDEPLTPEETTEVEEHLEAARRLTSNEPAAWFAALEFYGKAKKEEALQRLVQEAEAGKSLSEENKLLFLAEASIALGQEDQAADYYKTALEKSPAVVAVHVQAGRFFFKRDPDFARKCLEKAYQLEPKSNTVRRLLVMLIANHSRNEEDLQRMWELLGTNSEVDGSGIPDQRLRAMILIKRGGPAARREAQEILESIAGDSTDVTPIDRLLLADLYKIDGNTAAVGKQLVALTDVEAPRPEHLAAYVDHLLNSGDFEKAATTLARLVKLEPQTSSFRTLSLTLRLFKNQKRSKAITETANAYLAARFKKATSPSEKANSLLQVAALYSSLEMTTEAEATYRRATEVLPQTYRAYAVWLAQQDPPRITEAVQLCLQQGMSDDTSASAITLGTVLSVGKPSPEDMRVAEPLLSAALQTHAKDLTLLMAVANCRLMQGEDDVAQRLFQRVLELDPDNLGALNNLAMLLGHRDSTQAEALRYIDRALTIAGMQPELLDSKGWVLLQKRDFARAEESLRAAVSITPVDPRYYFHLALACQMQGKLTDAREFLNRARTEKLPVHHLSPEERTQLASLDKALTNL